MKTTPIKVESYSGYKADEYPISFYWKEEKHNIKEIMDRWYDRNLTVDWIATNYFRVVTDSGLQCIIKHDIETDQWYLVNAP
jgi:hypothetical protein